MRHVLFPLYCLLFFVFLSSSYASDIASSVSPLNVILEQGLETVGPVSPEDTSFDSADYFLLSSGRNTVHGGKESDALTDTSEDGNNRLYGDEGNDSFFIQSHDDIVTGGEGADIFHVWRDVWGTVITDFSPSTKGEKIVIHGAKGFASDHELFTQLRFEARSADTVITFPNGATLTLQNLSPALVNEQHFAFASAAAPLCSKKEKYLLPETLHPLFCTDITLQELRNMLIRSYDLYITTHPEDTLEAAAHHFLLMFSPSDICTTPTSSCFTDAYKAYFTTLQAKLSRPRSILPAPFLQPLCHDASSTLNLASVHALQEVVRSLSGNTTASSFPLHCTPTDWSLQAPTHNVLMEYALKDTAIAHVLEIRSEQGLEQKRRYLEYVRMRAASLADLTHHYAMYFRLSDELARYYATHALWQIVSVIEIPAELEGLWEAHATVKKAADLAREGKDDTRLSQEMRDKALRYAVLNHYPTDTLAVLIQHGANLHTTHEGESLLMQAVANAELVHFLLMQGVDVHQTNTFGKTPLMYAAEWGTKNSMQQLLKKGADPKTTDNHKQRASHYLLKNTTITPKQHYAMLRMLDENLPEQPSLKERWLTFRLYFSLSKKPLLQMAEQSLTHGDHAMFLQYMTLALHKGAASDPFTHALLTRAVPVLTEEERAALP